MIARDEEALICDLAETYHIYDYKQLPPLRVAVFAVGLRENSRIKMKLNDQKTPIDTLILAGIADRLSVLAWMRSEDGRKGINRPTMLADVLVNKKPKETDVIVFKSGEDFEKTRNEIISNMAGGE